MGATYDHPAFDSPLAPHLSNDTLIDRLDQAHSAYLDRPIHLFILIVIWTILLVTIIFGTVGNILVLYVYINRKDKKTCTFFIKILAVVDLIICLVLAPLELYQITTGIRSEFFCKFYGFLTTHVLYSTLLITTIAFDRYFCICWPLYKIITVRRAHVIAVACGLFSSFFAIIPMNEYSTKEHFLHLHNNHSKHFPIKPSDGNGLPDYINADDMRTSGSMIPYELGNLTDVHCSPKFNLDPKLTQFINTYRRFHSALFAVCILLVLILYAFIYNAVYQRRVTRTRKLSAYRRIIRSYLMNSETEPTATQSSKSAHHHHHHHRRHQRHSPSTLTLICCYFCKTNEEFNHEVSRPSESALHEPLNEQQRRQLHRHIHDEPSSVTTHQRKNTPQVVLEVNGARGKRYSAISMTSMTYLTSGVWDETSSTNLIRSRINSIAATTYCGTEHSSTSRPSTSTEDSFEQTAKLLPLSSTLLQLRPLTPPNSTHLTVPGQQTMTTTTTATTAPALSFTTVEVPNKDQQLGEAALPRSVSQCGALLHPSIVRKTSNTLSIRQHQRPSDASVQQRKVSFMTSAGTVDRCISEDPPSTYQRSSLLPPISSSSETEPHQRSQSQHQLSVQMNSNRSLSTTLSIDPTSSSMRNFSISSARRPSAFDGETQRILERQQTQERLANIRTTFTLFIVTATFILMYLPSIIHTLFNIKPHDFREVLFLLYYINSACNPLIYSFFNVNFRNDIRRIYECQKREYLARQY